MQYLRYLKAAAFVWVAIALFAPSGLHAQPTPAPSPTPDKWRVNITPYLWAPTINGSLHFSRADIRNATKNPPAPLELPDGAAIRLGPNNYLSKLNSALMFSIEARRGNGGFFGDVIYMNLSNTGASVASLSGPRGEIVIPVNVSTSARITETLATVGLEGGTPGFNGLVGLRYSSATANAGWSLTGPLGLFDRNGTASKNDVQTVPILGVKGRLSLSSHFFVPYYGDWGSNGAENTWQYFGGIAYGYHSGAAILAWRQLAYGADPSNPNGLVQLLQLGGPLIGWTFYL